MRRKTWWLILVELSIHTVRGRSSSAFVLSRTVEKFHDSTRSTRSGGASRERFNHGVARLWSPRSPLFRAGRTLPFLASNENVEEEDTKWQDANFVKRNAFWVVIVEDEEAIRQAVGDYLYDSGFQVSACDSARSFQELIDQQLKQMSALADTAMTRTSDQSKANDLLPVLQGRLPDVIVSDIRMPDMDGIELLGWIRAQPQLRRLPVVMLTAKGLTVDRIAGYRAGADFYLTKPFAPEELLGILDNCIVRRRQQLKADTGVLVDLQQDIAEIKSALKQNAANAVLKTTVYLTPAEREVITLLSQGYTNAEIASERGVTAERIVKILQKLYATTGTKTRTELLRWAVRTGYVPKR